MLREKKVLILILVVLIAVLFSAVALSACKPEKYTVTFDADGGVADVTEISVEKGEAINCGDYKAQKKGYLFNGWRFEDGKEATVFIVNSDITLKAAWTPAAITVKYVVNGEVYLTDNYVYGEDFVTPVYDGEGAFFGWFSDGECTVPVSQDYTPEQDVTLYGLSVSDNTLADTFEFVSYNDGYKITGIKDQWGSTTLTVPASYSGKRVYYVDTLAFAQNPNVRKIYFAKGVELRAGVFADSPNLTSVIFSSGSEYTSVSGTVRYLNSTLYACLPALEGSYTVGTDFTCIEDYAFAGCDKLTEVRLSYGLSDVGKRIFAECADNLSIILEDYPGYTYSREWNCSEMTGSAVYGYNIADKHTCGDFEYIIRKGEAILIKYIGQSPEVTVPLTVDGVRVSAIGNAFYGNTVIKSLTLGENITQVVPYAFAGCTSLLSVRFANAGAVLGEGAFSGCISLSEVVLPDRLAYISDFLFAECYALTSLDLPDTVVSIGEGAFSYTGIRSIEIPASVKIIENFAFMNNYTGIDRLTIYLLGSKEAIECDWDMLSDHSPYVTVIEK